MDVNTMIIVFCYLSSEESGLVLIRWRCHAPKGVVNWLTWYSIETRRMRVGRWTSERRWQETSHARNEGGVRGSGTCPSNILNTPLIPFFLFLSVGRCLTSSIYLHRTRFDFQYLPALNMVRFPAFIHWTRFDKAVRPHAWQCPLPNFTLTKIYVAIASFYLTQVDTSTQVKVM